MVYFRVAVDGVARVALAHPFGEFSALALFYPGPSLEPGLVYGAVAGLPRPWVKGWSLVWDCGLC